MQRADARIVQHIRHRLPHRTHIFAFLGAAAAPVQRIVIGAFGQIAFGGVRVYDEHLHLVGIFFHGKWQARRGGLCSFLRRKCRAVFDAAMLQPDIPFSLARAVVLLQHRAASFGDHAVKFGHGCRGAFGGRGGGVCRFGGSRGRKRRGRAVRPKGGGRGCHCRILKRLHGGGRVLQKGTGQRGRALHARGGGDQAEGKRCRRDAPCEHLGQNVCRPHAATPFLQFCSFYLYAGRRPACQTGKFFKNSAVFFTKPLAPRQNMC